MRSFIRIVTFAFQDIARNIGLSFMTVLILVLMLLSVNTLFIIRHVTTEATQTIREQIDVSIYFHAESNEEEVSEIRDYVDSFTEVVNTTFYTQDEVLDQFREAHQNNPEILASLDELDENPLGPTLVVKTRTPEDYEKVITALNIPEYEHIVEAKTFADTQRAIERVSLITNQVEKFTIGLTAFFAFIAFLIIFNTIRVAIYTQRIEISIKKLVGASNWFVRGPYIVESFIFSTISVFITLGGVILTTKLLDPYLAVIFKHSNFLTNYYLSNILLLAGIQFGVVFFLTLFSSMLAMRRHLRV